MIILAVNKAGTDYAPLLMVETGHIGRWQVWYNFCKAMHDKHGLVIEYILPNNNTKRLVCNTRTGWQLMSPMQLVMKLFEIEVEP